MEIKNNLSQTKTLLLVDDHQVVRIGIKAWLEENTDWKIIHDCGNISDCFGYLQETETLPAVVLVDIDLGNESGFDLISELGEKYSQIKAVVYSMHEESGYVLQAKKLGAKGYIPKGEDMKEFPICLNEVFNGKEYLNPKLKSKQEEIQELTIFLTEKQKLILQEILKNKNNEEISKELNLSIHTIEVYVTVIYDTLGVKTRKELVEKFR